LAHVLPHRGCGGVTYGPRMAGPNRNPRPPVARARRADTPGARPTTPGEPRRRASSGAPGRGAAAGRNPGRAGGSRRGGAGRNVPTHFASGGTFGGGGTFGPDDDFGLGPGGPPGPDEPWYPGGGDPGGGPRDPRGPGGRGPGGFGPGGPGRGGRGPGGPRGPRRPLGPGGGPGPGRRRSIIWRMRRPMFLVALAMLAILAGVGVVFARTELPPIQDLSQSSYICAGDVRAGQCTPKNAMTRLGGDKSEDRTNVRLKDVPPIVRKAVLATEDRDFYHHDGINPAGIARAFYQDVKGGSTQGGSTITQQYVKNAFDLTRERSVTRKAKEAMLSIKLEQQMSKDDILEGYLNTIYFGRGAYGIGAASEAYFGKDVKELGAPEGALLAGLIRAPSLAEPTKHPEEALRRRNVTLAAMHKLGEITDDQYTLFTKIQMKAPFVRDYSSVKIEDTLRGGPGNDYMGTDYLPKYIRGQLKAIDPVKYTDDFINAGGLRIYTSINYEMQRAAWQAVTSTLDREDDPKTPEWEGDPEASMVAIDDNGLVRAMVASRHPFTPKVHENNFAVRGNGSNGFQPGSTFKPLVLTEALREGYSLRSRFDALGHIEFPGLGDKGAPWKVANYSESAEGVMDLMRATAQSSNTAYAQLMVGLGTDYVPTPDGASLRQGPTKVAALAESMGIGGAKGIPDRDTVPSLVLGVTNATPLEMAGAYTTFANRGVYKKPDIVTRVEQVDQDGNTTVLYQRQVHQKRIVSQDVADRVTYALQGVLKPGSTGAGAAFGKPAAGKTGTAQENRASWFTGFTPKLTASVWMGYPDVGYLNPETGKKELWPMNFKGRPVHGRAATGGSFPAEIWKKFMTVATGNSQANFVDPSQEQIDKGEVINQDKLLTSDESATTVPPNQIPFPTVPNPRRGHPRTTLPPTPTTVDVPDPTPTTAPTTTLTVPTIPGGGGGGGGGGPGTG
jgi:membrane peptidoglycan carboxypeptidase